MFVLPVKRKEGFFNLVVQNQDKSFIYTFIEDYKKDPSNATPYLVITLYDELLFKKGLILVRGDIIGDLTVEDSHKLFQMTKDFYSVESLFKRVLDFNKNSRKFNVNSHISYCLGSYYSNISEEIDQEKIKNKGSTLRMEEKNEIQPKKRNVPDINMHGENAENTVFSIDTKSTK